MIRVLMAEDPDLFLALKDSFLSRAETELRTCATGEDAVRLAGETRPDLVVLDAAMGDGDGFEVCRAIKRLDGEQAAGAGEGVPVWLTGRSTDEPKAVRAGAEGMIARPFERERILRALAARLPRVRRGASRRQARLQVDFFRGEREAVGYTADVGSGGLFLRTRETLVDEETLPVIFALPGEPRVTVRAEARVLRATPPGDDAYGMTGYALEFTRIGERDRSALRVFAEAVLELP